MPLPHIILSGSVSGPGFAASILPDAAGLLESFGPWVLLGIAIVIFIESGVLFPFLPGDSLLVTMMILAKPLGIEPWQGILVAIIAAIAGDQVGYWLGRGVGRKLFKPEARVLRTDRLEAAERFFAKYGGPSLVLGRFVPIVRTYVPLAAGTASMPFRKFVWWNISGAVIWVGLMSAVGLLLGGIPFIVDHIDILMIVIILVSVVPVAVPAIKKYVQYRRARKADSEA